MSDLEYCMGEWVPWNDDKFCHPDHGQCVHCELERVRDENGALRHAVIFAAETFGKITSSDGSGHADLGRAVLRIAGKAISSPANPS